MNKKNQIIATIVAVIVVGGGAFYGGMQYGTAKTKAAQLASRGGFGGGANGGGQRGLGGQRGGAAGANGGAGDFATGQILSADSSSVTIKTRNGSSQIVYFSPSTTIGKSVSGATSDLSAGQQITVSGKSNPDGSIAAQDIQIRPTQPNNQ